MWIFYAFQSSLWNKSKTDNIAKQELFQKYLLLHDWLGPNTTFKNILQMYTSLKSDILCEQVSEVTSS